MSRRTLINLVFFLGVFALMLFWAVNNIITVDQIEKPYTITGDFAQAAGVKKNAEITYLGVHYGRVSSVERTAGGVRISMKIDRDKHIPVMSVARVFRKSAIGEPYIDFKPPSPFRGDDAGFIEKDDNVPLSQTQVPLEFSELLRSASALISSIDPETAGSLVHELSLALDGRGESLQTLTKSFDEITTSFVAKTEQLDRLAENSTRLTAVVADHRTSLSSSIANLRALAESLRAANGDTKVLLDLGPDFLGITADLVADEKQNLDCLLTDLAPIASTLAGADQLNQLVTTFEQGPLAFGYVANTLDHDADGTWVRINLMLTVDGEAPDVFVPPKTLPVVPSVASCDSPLRPVSATSSTPSGVSTRPASSTVAGRTSTSQRQSTSAAGTAAGTPSSDGSLANTGGPALAALGLLLLVGAGLLWRTRRPGSAGAASPAAAPRHSKP
jgi:phospholipid/cholesterol/gamma-HCH transport system substrate-binding protein